MDTKVNKNEWIEWLQVKGLSPRTIQEYNSYFEKVEIGDLSQKTAISFLQRYNNIVARAFLKNLILYLKMNGSDLNIEIPKITGRKRTRIPDVLTEDQINELSQYMKTERSKLMLLITFYGGLRISELVGSYAIQPYSFNWHQWIKDPGQNGVLKIIGKGNKQRNVFVPQKIMSRLYQWIRNEASQKQGKNDKLFKIGERRWKVILSETSQKALGKHINPHLIRHSCGTWLKRNGWDLDEIRQYLGHEHISTTTIYAHIDQENLKDKFNSLTN